MFLCLVTPGRSEGGKVRHYNRWRRLQLRLDNIGDCSEEDHALSNQGTAGYLIWLNGAKVFAQLYRSNWRWLFSICPDNQMIPSWHFDAPFPKKRLKKMLTDDCWQKRWIRWDEWALWCDVLPPACLYATLFERLRHFWWARGAQDLGLRFLLSLCQATYRLCSHNGPGLL